MLEWARSAPDCLVNPLRMTCNFANPTGLRMSPSWANCSPDCFALFPSRGSCHKAREMTNRIALGIGIAILAVLALDYAFGTGLAVFIGRRFLDLINLVAVWR